jgi:pimeloyl-ACP methyl ester carboxylesterase
VLTSLAILVLLVVAAFASVIALSAPASPPPMQSVGDAFKDADFTALPAVRHFTARDGAALAYRAYPGDPARIVIVIHGSSGTTRSMHLVAEAIHAKGPTVYALAMRGHDGTGRSGDIDYIGQLDDDVADFVKTLGPRAPNQTRTLLGFSSGGGFALRLAGGPDGALFDRLILVSPQFPYDAPTARPDAGGWVSVAVPRLVALSLLTRLGITAFNGLPVLAMAVDPARLAESHQTPVYSFRMLRNFGPGDDYLGDVRRFHGPIALFVGADDEIFRAERFAPLLKPVRPDIAVTVLPGLGHMDMTVKPAALAALAAAAG